MKKLFCSILLLTAACCYAEEVDDDFPHFEANREFLVTVTQHIHAYRNEDKLMMEKKARTVKAISPPKDGPRSVKVKMDVNPKKRRVTLITKTPF